MKTEPGHKVLFSSSLEFSVKRVRVKDYQRNTQMIP